MNVFEIDAASNNGVDNVREIREQVAYPPTEGNYKVYIIDEVQMMSSSAFNALLKTLEEPPAYVIFILATTDPQKIPRTVLSRCQRYDFRRLDIDTVAAQIDKLVKAEHIEIEDRAVRYIARAADGAMRDGLSLLEQCLGYHYGEKLTYQNVLDILGAADTESFSKLFRAIVHADTEQALRIVAEATAAGKEMAQFVTDFILYLRNVLLCSSTEDADDLFDISEDNLALLKEDAGIADRRKLLSLLYSFSELSNRMRAAIQRRIILEVELIRICTGTVLNQTSGAPAGAAGGSMGGKTDPVFAGTGTQTEAGNRANAMRISAAAKAMLEKPNASKDTLSDAAPVQAGAERTGTSNTQAGRTADTPQQSNAEAGTGKEASAAEAEGSAAVPRMQAEEALQLVQANWTKLLADLMPSNRAVFAGVVLRAERGRIVVVFRNMINYKIAAMNREENGLLRLKALCAQRYGFEIAFAARIAGPGEFPEEDDRATDEELARIHFPVDIEES